MIMIIFPGPAKGIDISKRAPGSKRTLPLSAANEFHQILFASVAQMILFGQPPNLIEIAGMIIIMMRRCGAW